MLPYLFPENKGLGVQCAKHPDTLLPEELRVLGALGAQEEQHHTSHAASLRACEMTELDAARGLTCQLLHFTLCCASLA